MMQEVRPNIPQPKRWGTKKNPVTGEEMYTCARWVKDTCQAHRVNGMLLDLFSASALCGVADKLSPDLRVKLLDMPLDAAVVVSFKLIEMSRG
jgi:hypothetical protein